MNSTIRVLGCMLALGGVVGAADAEFSQSLPAADFAAAGLSKLSPAELARLDALVKAYKPGVAEARDLVTAPPRGGIREAAAPAGTVVQPAPAAAPISDTGRSQKVTVAAGRKVEYSEIESRIAGEFSGWEPRTVFTLENGQRWQADASTSYLGDRVQNPAVKITPGLFGSYWMTVEGVRQRVKVKPVGGQ